MQDQLHESLKGNESQIIKWEEKYFQMYDKWQESENRIRELNKFEEKHLQMQNLFANFTRGAAGSEIKGKENYQDLFEILLPATGGIFA